MNLPEKLILAILAIYCLVSCANIEVETKYGNFGYDGKTVKIAQK